jgi:hypothetical protein
MADAKTERDRAIATDRDDVRRQWFDEGFKAGAEAERARIQAVQKRASSQQTEATLTMTHEASPKTEHQHLLAAMLRSTQMSLRVPSDSFTVSLGNICDACGAKHADLVRLFSAENPVTVGDFVMAYEAKRDRIHFAKTKAFDAGPLTSFAPPVSPAAPDPVELAPKVDGSMPQEQVAAVARQEWQNTPSLHREFTSEATYVAFRKAEAAGRVRILGSARKQ